MTTRDVAHVIHHSNARGTDKLVLIGIADHDGDGGSWPSLETLAEYANVDTRTVRRSIRNLEAMGELVVITNGGGGRHTRGDRRPNLYRITVPERPSRRDREVAAHEPPPTPTGPEEGGGSPTTTPVDNAKDGGTPTSPRPAPREDAGVTHGGTPTSPELALELKNPPDPPASGGPKLCLTGTDPHRCTWAHPASERRCQRHRRHRANCLDCHQPPAPGPPPWCGQCDPQGEHTLAARMVPATAGHGVTRCPRCHPGTTRQAAAP